MADAAGILGLPKGKPGQDLPVLAGRSRRRGKFGEEADGQRSMVVLLLLSENTKAFNLNVAL